MAAGGAGVEEVIVVVAGRGAGYVLLFDAGRGGEVGGVGAEVAVDGAGRAVGDQARLFEGDFEGAEVGAEGEAVGEGEVVDLVVGEGGAVVEALCEGCAVGDGKDLLGAGDAAAEFVFGEGVAAAEEGEEGFGAGDSGEGGDAGLRFRLPAATLALGAGGLPPEGNGGGEAEEDGEEEADEKVGLGGREAADFDGVVGGAGDGGEDVEGKGGEGEGAGEHGQEERPDLGASVARMACWEPGAEKVLAG